MKRIEVNNGCTVEIEDSPGGVTVRHRNDHGDFIDIDTDQFTDGEIVMALNLLRYMREQDSKCAYVLPYREEEYRRFFSTNIDHGNLVEFQIFE